MGQDQTASDEELAPGTSQQLRGKISARREHATQLRVEQARARLDTASARDITAEERARVAAARDRIADRRGRGAAAGTVSASALVGRARGLWLRSSMSMV